MGDIGMDSVIVIRKIIGQLDCIRECRDKKNNQNKLGGACRHHAGVGGTGPS